MSSSQTSSSAQGPAPTAESGGEVLLAIPGGGDIYYRLSSTLLRSHALAHPHLLLHHSARTRRDHRMDLTIKIELLSVVLFVPACFVVAPVFAPFGFLIMLLAAAALSVVVAMLFVRRKAARTANWGWEVKKWINTASKKYVSQFDEFGEVPASKQIVRNLDSLLLLGAVNHDWESGSTDDLYLIDRPSYQPCAGAEAINILCKLHMGPGPSKDVEALGLALSEAWGIPFVNRLDD